MEKIIVVEKSEVLQGTKGDYLKVTDKNGKVQNIFDQSLWNLFGDGLAVKLTLEKQGNWWNVVTAEGVAKELAEREPKPVADSIRENMEWKDKQINEKFWWNQLGESLRTGLIDREKPAGKSLEKFYKAKMQSELGFTVEKKEE